jgi:glutathione S-transferase
MQKIVTDRLRPDGRGDPVGVEEARGALLIAYDLVDEAMGKKTWAIGEAFTMADCAAAPALHYANLVAPFGDRANLAAYFDRLLARPSVARVMKEAEPYRDLFPKERTPLPRPGERAG